ncbi:MAG: hypothetical protein NPIRA03_25560 [Nitrospirales bacterium]|nr:MAG: hypothetical protein NPIRA03_25560 [Nitrospirales bacterium]
MAKNIWLILFVFLLAGCTTINGPDAGKLEGYDPFGLAGGYDLGSLIAKTDNGYRQLLSRDYFIQMAKDEKRESVKQHLEITQLPSSPSYEFQDTTQFISSLKFNLLKSSPNLSAEARAALKAVKEVKIDVEKMSRQAVWGGAALQYHIFQSIRRPGPFFDLEKNVKIAIGKGEKPFFVTELLIYEDAHVDLIFDGNISGDVKAELTKMDILKSGIDIKLNKDKNLSVKYSKPTIVAFQGFPVDTETLKFVSQNGKLPQSTDYKLP